MQIVLRLFQFSMIIKQRFFEAMLYLIFKKQLDVMAQAALIALQRKNTVWMPIDDRFRNIFPAPHCIDGHNAPFNCRNL